MHRSIAAFVLAVSAGCAAAPAAIAHDFYRPWHPRGHGHGWGHYRGFGPPAPVYYGQPYPPPRYFRPPPPPAFYGYPPPPPPVPYYDAPARGGHYGRMSDTLPIVAGGIVGGAVANEVGAGNPAAVISGSVLGSVVGRELAR